MFGQFLNEEKYQKTKRSLKGITRIILLGLGIPMLIAGIVLLVVGFVGANENLNIFLFVGIPLLGVGFMFCAISFFLLFFTHTRDILSFGASGIAPVAGETVNYLADKTSPAIEKTAEAITKGVVKGKNSAATKPNVKFCTNCGAENRKDAKFCYNCGEKLL